MKEERKGEERKAKIRGMKDGEEEKRRKKQRKMEARKGVRKESWK